MDLEQIKKEVEQAAQDKRLNCHDARALAEKLGVDYSQVGKACDELEVKIFACELGCF
ncbi:MAG: hypothetical protein Kow00122_15650 [Thermoleophilia bacterium]|nr:hypothetical protein [Actinomycetota bacterium]